MKQVYIEAVPDNVGKEITIRGWLYNKTHKGKLWFLLVRDGTGSIQSVLFKGKVSSRTFEEAESLTQESSLQITGVVRRDERAPSGFELDATRMEIVQIAEPYPITPKGHGPSFLMDNRHLWLRSARQQAILKVRHQLIKAARDFLDQRGFVLLDTPILTPVACEGTTNLFPVQYFDDHAYLSQSGQLYSEASCMAFGKVYCFGPTFRAEKSKTRRHLMEFWMVEPEVAFADLDDIMHLAEEFVCYLVEQVLKERTEELALLKRDTVPLEKVRVPFPKITYDEAFDLLDKHGSLTHRGSDLGGTDETIISSRFDRPVIVHRYPKDVKGFYMEPDPMNPDLVLCMDILAPEGYGEIIGGSQRIHDHDLLVERAKEHKLPLEPLSWYLDLRKFGTVPHSGFGMGIERVLTWICGIQHVRETIPFPRMLHRLYP